MKRLLAIIVVIGLSGCAKLPASIDVEDETVADGVSMQAPLGAILAAADATCAQDPACVCTLPSPDRPTIINTPQAILDRFPDALPTIEVKCDDL